ncbi:hypothetical protein ACRALDRAFT_1073960 [Sodiomyces alcalophilus JCM 7366]|uniref:uncharacterized protein n=1 Tax=Sodiomyces alcalophilus JCM 7366 TaxID=591952 RepID=UPI0039B4C3CA
MVIETRQLDRQERHLALVSRQTIVCLDHFITMAKHICSNVTTSPSTVLVELPNPAAPCPHAGRESPRSSRRRPRSKPPTPPTRIQPGRAAKGTRPPCAAPTKRKKPPSTWIVRGLPVGSSHVRGSDDTVLHPGDFVKNGVAQVPQRQPQAQAVSVPLPEASALADQLSRAVERVKRQRQRGTACAFGPAPWVCDVCRAEDVTRTSRGFVVTEAGCHAGPGAGIGAPVAIMTPGCSVGSNGAHYVDAGWDFVAVREDQVVRLGPLRFVMDACDGQAMLLFLSGDWSGG